MERLNSFVKSNWDMELHDFLSQKVEVECLYNYQIAALLNVEKKLVGELIRKSGLRRTQGFFTRRFEETYGKGSTDTFKNMIEELDTSLSDVARYFGFSREYARQVYLKFFGRPYSEALYEKRQKIGLFKEEISRNSKKTRNFMGRKNKRRPWPILRRISYDGGVRNIFVNGFKLAFRFSERPFMSAEKLHFRITYQNPGSHKGCDFLICLCGYKDKKTYYVIPNHAIPKYGICLIPQAGTNESKYARFRETWEPLLRFNNKIGKKHRINKATVFLPLTMDGEVGYSHCALADLCASVNNLQ